MLNSPTAPRTKASADASVWSVLAIGLGSRLGLLFVWFWVGGFDYGDVSYYWDRTYHLAERGLENSLIEYPTPVAWLLNLPQVLSGGDRPSYAAYFALMMLLFDLLLCVGLWRMGGPRRGQGIIFWSVFQLMLGTLVWLRFDIVPAALVGLAALAAARRPAVAGVMLGLGAAIKLWPAALLSLFAHRTSRWRALAGFVVSFGGLVALSIATAGVDRLISPLTWQNDRGLQIESVWATGLMIQRAGNPELFPVQMSPYQAFEVFGPGREETLQVASVATLVGLAACAFVVLLHWWSGRPTQVTVSLTMLMAISMIVLTNKTFSPQYVTWLAGPLAVLIAQVGLRDQPEGAAPPPGQEPERIVSPALVRRWTWELLGIAILSQLVYPAFYDYLWVNPDPTGVMLGTVTLTARNALVVLFTLDLTVATVLVLWRRRARSSAPDVSAAPAPVAPTR